MGSYNNNVVPVKPPFGQIGINLEWTDGYGTGGKRFDTVQQMADFLRDSPEFGKAVGYVVKEKRK